MFYSSKNPEKSPFYHYIWNKQTRTKYSFNRYVLMKGIKKAIKAIQAKNKKIWYYTKNDCKLMWLCTGNDDDEDKYKDGTNNDGSNV